MSCVSAPSIVQNTILFHFKFQVFGIIHLAMFIASPIFGHFLPRLGLRRVFSFGVTFVKINRDCMFKTVFFKVLATAGCACCFGLLGLVQSTWGFLGFSYALRLGYKESHRIQKGCFCTLSSGAAESPDSPEAPDSSDSFALLFTVV